MDDSELYKVNNIHDNIFPSGDSIEMRALDNKVEYDRVESGNFFDSNHSTIKSHNTAAYLVRLAVCKTRTAYKALQNDDIILHLLIAKSTALLTRFHRIEFGFILEMLR